MKRLLYIIAIISLFIASSPVAAQKKLTIEKPNLDSIKSVVLDPNNKFYYPKLRKLYERNDTIMTQEQYRFYYLGYMFQEDYNPYRQSNFASVTEHLQTKEKLTKEDCDTIIKYAELSLKDNPFDLRQMAFLIHALHEKKKTMRATIWEYRLQNILGAIKSTGTGESLEQAWFVISPIHEYDLLNLLGYQVTAAEYIEPGYDYLKVTKEQSTNSRRKTKIPEGFYFNVQLPQAEYIRKFVPADQIVIEEQPADDAPIDSQE